MGRTANKKQRGREELKLLKVEKRQALIRLCLGVGGFIVYVAVEQSLIYAGVLDGSNPALLAVTFIFAVAMAGVAGWATRDWSRANRRMQELERMLASKKK